MEGALAARSRLRALLRLPGGESNSGIPTSSTTTTRSTPPATPEEGYHLSKDLTDKAIQFIRDAKAVAPEKPWYMYFCPGAAHAPHHVFKEWSDRYAGRFDEGYEAIRATDPRQPEGARAASRRHRAVADQPARRARRDRPAGQPWPKLDLVRPWDSLDDDEKRLFARMAEVYAGFV